MKPIVVVDPDTLASSAGLTPVANDGYSIILGHPDGIRVFYPPVAGETASRPGVAPVVVLDEDALQNPEVVDDLRRAGYIVVATKDLDKVRVF